MPLDRIMGRYMMAPNLLAKELKGSKDCRFPMQAVSEKAGSDRNGTSSFKTMNEFQKAISPLALRSKGSRLW